ncbi:MAG: hypothetical protein U0V74_04715 [Chitinophagales bacterium]
MKQLYADYSFFIKIIAGAIVYMLFFTSMADGQSVTGKWKAESVTHVLVPQGQDPAKAELVKQMLADLTITVGADKSFTSHTTQPMFLNISGANWVWDPGKAILAVVDNVIPGGDPATLMTWQITEISGNKAMFTFKDGTEDVLTVQMAKEDVQ